MYEFESSAPSGHNELVNAMESARTRRKEASQ